MGAGRALGARRASGARRAWGARRAAEVLQFETAGQIDVADELMLLLASTGPLPDR